MGPTGSLPALPSLVAVVICVVVTKRCIQLAIIKYLKVDNVINII